MWLLLTWRWSVGSRGRGTAVAQCVEPRDGGRADRRRARINRRGGQQMTRRDNHVWSWIESIFTAKPGSSRTHQRHETSPVLRWELLLPLLLFFKISYLACLDHFDASDDTGFFSIITEPLFSCANDVRREAQIVVKDHNTHPGA